MLKLEKTSREGTINVIVRDKEPLFTKPFALAFAIALGFHLFLMMLFHISPLKIGTNDTFFPPTSVEADASLKESALAVVEHSIQHIRGLPLPPVSRPILRQQPEFIAVRPIEHNKVENSRLNSFAEIENEVRQPKFHPLATSQKKPLEVIISGTLAGQPLLSNGLDDHSLPTFPSSKEREKRMAYSVMVEGRTGKIFWFESKQPTSHSPIDSFAEKVLRGMKFAADPQMVAVNGEVELQFRFNLEDK